VLGGAAQKAFDISQEPDTVRDRYGRDSLGDKTLLARRLVEAGVTFVTSSDAWGHWDHHRRRGSLGRHRPRTHADASAA
jgi:hypothetical protein